MYNEKKKVSNERYLAKFKTISIRIPAETFPAVEQAAKRAEISASAYIVRAITEKLERDGK
jgi:predicted HicB family RNase H-like nuclease